MKILVRDHGQNTEVAIALAEAGHHVTYCVPWDEAYPPSSDRVVGRGLEGLHTIDPLTFNVGFWLEAFKSDLIAFFDTFSEDDVWMARNLPHKPLVWGAGPAERLEQDRIFARQLQTKMGMPVAPYKAIIGLVALEKHLRANDDKWIKMSHFRGDIETFHHENWESTSIQYWGLLLSKLGAYSEHVEFVVEDPIKGPEVGYDGFFIDGEYASPAIVGYEAKDEAYMGCFTRHLPKSITDINLSLCNYFNETEAKTFFSSEIRLSKENYLIDPCVRCPHPPTAAMLVQITNIADVITEGARGNLITLKPAAQYSAAIVIESGWAADHWTQIKIDPKVRHLVKLQRAYKDGTGYWAIPGAEVVATCVGLGDSPEEARDAVEKVVAGVSCRGMSYNLSALDTIINKTIPEGRKHGILF